MPELAIIIPAYKSAFLHAALQSLSKQTCQDFNVYVGDDCSPFQLKEIVESFADTLKISYTRFDHNIGSKNLVNQWTRSVALSRDEKWIWLFSDDDIADHTCVENFFRIVDRNKNRFEIYRFNTAVIDEDGKVIRHLPEGPSEESSEEMAYYLLMDQRGNAMQDHIFSRAVYERKGGFVFTEYAQGADWATSILFSQDKGIAIIPGSKFYWRLSSSNISGFILRQKSQMLFGHLQFLTWVLSHFKFLKTFPSTITYEKIKESARFNLTNVLIHHYKGVSGQNLLNTVSFMRTELGLSVFQIMYDLKSVMISTTRAGRGYVRLNVFLRKTILNFLPGKQSTDFH